MNRFDTECASKFAELCDKAGVEMTPENAIKCVEFAHEAMLSGECSVEAYYEAKRLILERVEVSNYWVN